MPDHLTPILLTAAFALIWVIVATSYVVDSLYKVRKNRRGTLNGPHLLSTARKSRRTVRKAAKVTS